MVTNPVPITSRTGVHLASTVRLTRESNFRFESEANSRLVLEMTEQQTWTWAPSDGSIAIFEVVATMFYAATTPISPAPTPPYI